MEGYSDKNAILKILKGEFIKNVTLLYIFSNNGSEILLKTKDDIVYYFDYSFLIDRNDGKSSYNQSAKKTEDCIVIELSDKKVRKFAHNESNIYALTENGELYQAIRQKSIDCTSSEGKSKNILPKFVELKIKMYTYKTSKVRLKDICAGFKFALALSDEGEIYAWGDNEYGQLGLGDLLSRDSPTKLNQNIEFSSISCGKHHSIGLSKYGQVYYWGLTESVKKFGLKDEEEIDIIDIARKSLNEDFSDETKTLYKVGSLSGASSSSQLYGISSLLNVDRVVRSLVVPKSLGALRSLSSQRTLTLRSDTLRKNYAAFNLPNICSPMKLSLENQNFVKISCGPNHSILLTDKGLLYFISNGLGRIRTQNKSRNFMEVEKNYKYIDISSLKHLEISMAFTKEMKICMFNIKRDQEEFKIFLEETNFRSFSQLIFERFEVTNETINLSDENNSLECSDKSFVNRANIIENRNDWLNQTIDSMKMKEIKRNGEYITYFDEISIISYGGMGVVIKALDKLDGALYAIKKIPLEEEDLKETIGEIHLLVNLKCKFVVECISAWVEDNYMLKENVNDLFMYNGNLVSNHKIYNQYKVLLLHIQMELCQQTLRETIAQIHDKLETKTSKLLTPLAYYVASELFIEILECVDYLHSQYPAIIHRDLKPSNILITFGNNGRFVKLADFGLATVHKDEGESHTKEMGTMKYVAPEVMISSKYDTRADIYSLGLIVRELFEIELFTTEYFNDANVFETKYSYLTELMAKMMWVLPRRRPSCGEILNDKSKWALDFQDLYKDIPSRNFIDSLDKPSTHYQTFTEIFLKNKLENFKK